VAVEIPRVDQRQRVHHDRNYATLSPMPLAVAAFSVRRARLGAPVDGPTVFEPVGA
jgi:hypothetical protein